jgi:alkylation response protein AidB-like acyl-CoA dehydrogenase
VAELLDPKTNKWKISGFKWFSSATTANMTLLLARTIDPATGLVQQVNLMLRPSCVDLTCQLIC